MDRGPGFISCDTLAAAKSLNLGLIHGKKAYPEGYGKIERFKRTALADLLRGLAGRPNDGSEYGALELRGQHYLDNEYNVKPHDSLKKTAPFKKFFDHERKLEYPENETSLRRKLREIIIRLVRIISTAGRNSMHLKLLNPSRNVSYSNCLTESTRTTCQNTN